MKKGFLVLSIVVLLSTPLSAQFNVGFDKREALDMIAICNSFTFQEVLDDGDAVLPRSYKEIYQSESIGFDNKWQLLQNDNYAVINLRGSTASPLSWLANVYSAMIPANGSITIAGDRIINYYLSDNPKANVHAGWTLAMIFLSEEIVSKIKQLNNKGVYYFIITGHSQGAAIAQLLRTYLEHAPDSIVDKRNKFKTYVFASPKPANDYYAQNYSNYFSSSSFIINNPKDPIINMPITKDDKPIIDFEEVFLHMDDTNKDYLKILAYKAIGKILAGKEDSLYIKKSGKGVHKKVFWGKKDVEIPPYVADMSYCFPVKPQYIQSFSEVNFINKRYYKDFVKDSTSMFYQHKPYLYFLEIQKEYFHDEFMK